MSGQHQIPGEQASYPRWVCERCALAAGGHLAGESATWHYDTCEVCAVKTAVSQPRDFGYPDFRTLTTEKLHGPQGHHP